MESVSGVCWLCTTDGGSWCLWNHYMVVSANNASQDSHVESKDCLRHQVWSCLSYQLELYYQQRYWQHLLQLGCLQRYWQV